MLTFSLVGSTYTQDFWRSSLCGPLTTIPKEGHAGPLPDQGIPPSSLAWLVHPTQAFSARVALHIQAIIVGRISFELTQADFFLRVHLASLFLARYSWQSLMDTPPCWQTKAALASLSPLHFSLELMRIAVHRQPSLQISPEILPHSI